MKKVLLILSFFVCLVTSGQTTPADRPVTGQTNWGNQLIIADKNGRPFKPGYDQIIGSPFYLDDWTNAVVTSAIISDTGVIKVKFDLYNQDLHYLKPDNDILIVSKGFINAFRLLDSAGTVIASFRSHFPEIDKQSSNTYYQVVVDGKAQLLKLITKKVIELKNDISGEATKEFTTYQTDYVYKEGVIKSFKKDKEFVLALFTDQQEKINSYLASKKLNFRNLDDVAGLFKFYNSLFKAF
jgi:hypothetical protein